MRTEAEVESVIKPFNNNLLHQLTASSSQLPFKMKSRKYCGLIPVLVRVQQITSQKQNLEEQQRVYIRREAGLGKVLLDYTWSHSSAL